MTGNSLLKHCITFIYRKSGASFFQLLQVLILSVLISGCGANVKKADLKLIKEFDEPKVAADKTGVYVIRSSDFRGGGSKIWVAANDSVVAKIPNGNHIYLELDAGVNTINFIYGKTGFGYVAVDNKPGEVVYIYCEQTTWTAKIIDRDLGQTRVMKSSEHELLEEKRKNDGYDNQMVNIGFLDYPIMIDSTESVTPDEDHAVIRFYRPGNRTADTSYDIWDQNGYICSTKGGTYVSLKLKPGHYTFFALSEQYAILDADLEANKEYASTMLVAPGWMQAHIRLMPVDLNSDEGSRQVKGYKERLKEIAPDKKIIESEPIAKRVQLGYDFLKNKRMEIENDKAPKRDLPADFGK